MQHFSKRFALLAVAALAACGGGGGGSSSLPGGPPLQPSAVAGKLTLSIPALPPSGVKRGVRDVSPSAKSVSIDVAGFPPSQIADLSSTSPNCVTSGSSRTCTVPVLAPAGTDTITVTIYDGANATGKQLQTGTTSVTVQSGQSFTAAVTLASAVSSVTITLGRAYLGVPGPVPVTVVALDLDGNPIVGTYATPIALTDSDTSGTTQLSASTVTSSTQAVTITYSGAAVATPISITANASGHSAVATFAPNMDSPFVDGSTATFATTLTGTTTANGGTPQTGSYGFTSTYTTKTKQTFNGLTGLVSISNTISSTSPPVSIANSTYLLPQAQGSNLAILQVGANTAISATTNSGPFTATVTDTYAAPYEIADLLPHAPGNLSPAYAASSEAISVDGGLGTATFTNNLDGSWSLAASGMETGGTAAATLTENLDGSGSGQFTQSNPGPGADYKDSVAFAAPSGSTVAVTITKQITSTSTPIVTTRNVPNWLPGGHPPNPLVAQFVTDNGSVSRPASCTVPSGYPATVTDVQTVQTRTDPILGFIYTSTTHQYSVPGVGVVCVITAFAISEFDSTATGALVGGATISSVSTLVSSSLTPSAIRATAAGSFVPSLLTAQAQALRIETIVRRLNSLQTATLHS